MDTTTTETVWVAQRAFKYAGRMYARGDVWEPGGHKNDERIKGTLVRLEERAATPPRRRKKSNG